VRYQILGPVELQGADGRIRLGGPKQRAVLALLLLNANRAVPEERFVRAVWGDGPPSSVRGQLQMYVSQLRKLVGGAVIVRCPPGYLIRVRSGELDLEVFEERMVVAGRAVMAGRVEEAVAGFRSALALWRGPALGGVTESLLESDGPALADRRLSALEEYFEALLAAGHHDLLVREVRAVAADNPVRERLQAQLMVALHRSGRTTEALEAYAATRSRLVAEQGVEPGSLLRETRRTLLNDDSPNPPAGPAVPRQLPAAVPAFAGRAAELARLDALSTPLVSICGGAGIGKTVLAIHWAHRIKDRFPDGQLYANLRGFDPGDNAATPEEVVRGFLEALNVPAERTPVAADALFGLYRSLLADKRILVVLDNARDAAQVRPLLPGSAGCRTVVTSRDQLSGLTTVEGASPVELDVLPPAEAHDLLTRRIGMARAAAEPEAVTEISTLCARLPLALAIVAARAVMNPGFSLASLAAELRGADGPATHDQQRPAGDLLDVLEAGDAAVSLRAVFSWSYLTLDPPAARLFRLLGLHPGPHVTVVAAASLLGEPVSRARSLLATLARAHLLVEPAPGRYTAHDLLRAYARELVHTVDTEDSRHAAVGRMLDHHLHTASRADRLLRLQRPSPVAPDPVPDRVTVAEVRTERQAIDWFSTEYMVLHALVEQAARAGFDRHACRLADMLTSTMWQGGARWLGDVCVYETALASARRLGEPYELGHSHRALAVFHLTHDRTAEAEAALTAALEWSERLGDVDLLADIHQGLGVVTGRTGRPAEQREHIETSLELFRTTGNRIGVANSVNHLAKCFANLGDHERAVLLGKQALELFAELSARKNEANTWQNLGLANDLLGHHDEAIACYRRAVELHRETRSWIHASNSLRAIGDIHHQRGSVAQARMSWEEAVGILEELRLPTDEVRARLDG